jgi:hypothetical protein
LVERRKRPATVTADVKALFNGSNGSSQLNPSFRSVDDSLGFAGPLSYHDPRRVADYWQPSSETSKRDSDPVIQDKMRQAGGSSNGPHQSHAARAISARTQSLDITSLNFSRALTGQSSAFGPVPASPGAASSSPGTATSQYFPGGHAPSALRANVTGRPVSSYDAGYDGVDSVAQGELSGSSAKCAGRGLSRTDTQACQMSRCLISSDLDLIIHDISHILPLDFYPSIRFTLYPFTYSPHFISHSFPPCNSHFDPFSRLHTRTRTFSTASIHSSIAHRNIGTRTGHCTRDTRDWDLRLETRYSTSHVFTSIHGYGTHLHSVGSVYCTVRQCPSHAYVSAQCGDVVGRCYRVAIPNS